MGTFRQRRVPSERYNTKDKRVLIGLVGFAIYLFELLLSSCVNFMVLTIRGSIPNPLIVSYI
jgi:hypothetical protein